MRVQIKKWGNSASVRIPASLMSAAALRLDQTVDVTQDGERLIIQPVATSRFDLGRMIAAMEPSTFPEDVDFGPPLGGEAW